jgi:transcription elongation GreA/GreB family factor
MASNVSNVWQVVKFVLEQEVMERTLVDSAPEKTDPATDLHTRSPIGRALLYARQGDEIDVTTPGGRVRVKLLEVR